MSESLSQVVLQHKGPVSAEEQATKVQTAVACGTFHVEACADDEKLEGDATRNWLLLSRIWDTACQVAKAARRHQDAGDFQVRGVCSWSREVMCGPPYPYTYCTSSVAFSTFRMSTAPRFNLPFLRQA